MFWISNKKKDLLTVKITKPTFKKDGTLFHKNPQPTMRRLVKNTNAYVYIDSEWVVNTNAKPEGNK